MPTLTWLGKDAVVDHHRKVPLRLLDEVPELAIPGTADGPTHTLIEGDNLHALKALLPQYRGRVDCIYIDPPYNTGNEGWVYNDNVNSPAMRDWLKREVGRDDLSRHDKWLCMMYPRLALMRELLSERGLICVSMDDSEIHRLRFLMDELFGDNNFVCTICWQKRYVSNVTAKWLSDMHDYVLVYAKNPTRLFVNPWKRTPEQESAYKNPDNDPRGEWRAQDLSASKPYSAGLFPITGPTGREFRPPPGRYWRCNETQFNKWVADNRIWWGKNRDARPMLKSFLNESEGGITPHTWWDYEFAGHNKAATLELKDLFEGASPFDTPKPAQLVGRLLETFTGKDYTVLDAFAGSGTTGHAVMALNAVDGGRRKCVLIQLGQDQLETTNISESITRERLARVSQGYTNAKGEQVAGLNQAWRYQRLGEPFTNAYGMPRTDLPFARLAPIVFFHATGEAMPAPVTDRAFLGVSSQKVGVYLLYNGDMDDKDARSRNVLTMRMLEKLAPHRGERLVYGAACRVEDAVLKQHRIVFRQYPQALAQVAS
jgi:site-specific DNA-methyltransferase (adenine-specific)/adenine-specific DNA-methyltransferase